MRQAQAADERQRRQEAVDQPSQPQQPHRREHARFVLDRVEIAERRERAHVGGGQDVLRRLRHFQTDRLRQFQRRIPQVREVADHEAGLARAQIVQVREHGLAIVERAQRVDHHDDVERPRQRPHESAVLDVADQKREIGMRLARLRDHAGAEVHADAERRFERGKEIAGAASELEHAGAFGDKKLQIEQILMVEEGGAREPFPALGRARVGEAADVPLARRHVAFAAVCARSHPRPYTRFTVHLPKIT